MSPSTFLTLFRRALSLSRRSEMHFTSPPSNPWASAGDRSFRELGLDPVPMAERYGFRAFKVVANTNRKTVKVGGHEQRGLLQLTDDPSNGKLSAIHREYVYESGLNTARCQPVYGQVSETAPHVLPTGETHGCGFYAYGATDHPDAAVPLNVYHNGLTVYVQAVIAGTGRRFVGDKGFTSQHLRIVALAFPVRCSLNNTHQGDGHNVYDLFGSRLERMIRRHYPDAAIFDSVEQMVKQFPLTPMQTPTQ